MILTHALSGIARSGATRAGYPVLQGAKLPLYALANIARAGATRSNYHSPQPFLSVGGIHRAWTHPAGEGVLAQSLTKADQLSGTPDTLTFTARGWVPIEGADVVLTLGSVNNLRREFGGTVLSTTHRYVGKPAAANMLYDVSAIDYTWSLNRYKVSGSYTGATVGAVAASLMASAPSGYALVVDADIAREFLDQITFTEQALGDALTQLVKRVGGEYLCDYLKVVHLFFENTTITAPTLVNAVHPSLASIQWTRDLSQVATRVYGNFGGSNTLDAIAPGASLLPVETAAWYQPEGGRVLVGQQRITYGGLDAGGGGSLVGPGASPSAAPTVSLQPGAGVDLGAHDYAVSFKTALGESLPGPRVTVQVGVFVPPTTAPLGGQPGPGANGPDPGAHDYAVSFVISTGETTPGPRVTLSTDLTPPPTVAPTPDAVNAGNGPEDGGHDYAITFLTATGETPPSAIGGQASTFTVPAPTSAVAGGAAIPTANGLPIGRYDYACTQVVGPGETTLGPLTTIDTTPPSGSGWPLLPLAPPTVAPVVTLGNRGSANIPWASGYAMHVVVSYRTPTGETTVGPVGSVMIPGAQGGVWQGVLEVGGIVTGPPGTQYRQLYSYGDPRDGTQTVYVHGVYDNTTVARYLGAGDYSIGNQTSQSGEVGPKTNTATIPAPAMVPIVNMPTTSDPRITGHRLYRRVNGGAGLALVRQFPPGVAQFGIGAPVLGGLRAAVSGSGPGPLSPGAYAYCVTWVTPEGESTPSPVTNAVTIINPAVQGRIDLYNLPLPASDSGVTARKLYRTAANGSVFKLVASLDLTVPSGQYTDALGDAGLGATAPTANSTGDHVLALGAGAPNTNTGFVRAIHLTGIQTSSSAAGASSRKLYRRSVDATLGLRYVTTIPDNTSTTYTDTTPNAALGASPPTVNTAARRQIPLSKIPIGNELVTARKVYRTVANASGGVLKLVATIGDNTTTTLLDTVTDAALGADALAVGSAQAAQVAIAAIPLGAPSVIARVLYRTKANAPQLQLLWTFDDNTTTTALDSSPDAYLGALPPPADTSGLQQPSGYVLVGSTSLPCATVAAFRSTGGWALVGSQNVRYTGISGNALLGIPASGPGAILATIAWNTTAVAAAMLTGIPTSGVGAIQYQTLKGDPVNVFVQVDDLAAQAAVRAQLVGSDGIIEDEIQDGRLSYTEGLARCRARLDLLGALDSDGKVGVITVSYVCRDINTQAGAMVSIYLGPPVNLRAELRIQRVSVARFNVPHLNPTYTVEASSLRFSAEEMLRLVRQGAL